MLDRKVLVHESAHCHLIERVGGTVLGVEFADEEGPDGEAMVSFKLPANANGRDRIAVTIAGPIGELLYQDPGRQPLLKDVTQDFHDDMLKARTVAAKVAGGHGAGADEVLAEVWDETAAWLRRIWPAVEDNANAWERDYREWRREQSNRGAA